MWQTLWNAIWFWNAAGLFLLCQIPMLCQYVDLNVLWLILALRVYFLLVGFGPALSVIMLALLSSQFFAMSLSLLAEMCACPCVLSIFGCSSISLSCFLYPSFPVPTHFTVRFKRRFVYSHVHFLGYCIFSQSSSHMML